MTQNRIVEAARQVMYGALTSPPLTYATQTGGTATLPVANVIPRNIWEIGPNASVPLVAIGVSSDRGRTPEAVTRATGERALIGRLTVVSGVSESEAVSIGDAIVSVFDFADQEGDRFSRDLSRKGSASTIAMVMRHLEVSSISDPQFEAATSRYTVTIELEMIAA